MSLAERRENPRFVLVELFDDAEMDAQTLAIKIVTDSNLGMVAKEARPAYESGFGQIVGTGTRVSGVNYQNYPPFKNSEELPLVDVEPID